MANVFVLNGPYKGEIVSADLRKMLTGDDTPTYMQEVPGGGMGLYRYYIKELTYAGNKFLAASLIPNGTDTNAPNWCMNEVKEAFNRYKRNNYTDDILPYVLAAKVAD